MTTEAWTYVAAGALLHSLWTHRARVLDWAVHVVDRWVDPPHPPESLVELERLHERRWS